MYKSTANSCKSKITFEDFRDGKVLRTGQVVEGTPEGGWYTKATKDDQLDINDDTETAFTDQGSMNPYEVYNAEKFLCSSGASPCIDSVGGFTGDVFTSTGTWKSGCALFNS